MTFLAIDWQAVGYSTLTIVVFITIAFAVFSLISARNMKKSREALRAVHENLKTGDKIIFAGGLKGEITLVEDEEIRVKIAENVIVRADRFSIQAVIK